MFRLTAGVAAAEPVFAAAAALLGADPREWVPTADAESLKGNRAAQILCTTQALAAHAALAPLLPERLIVAGYSVGQLGAWGVAGMLEPAALLALAARRAELMDQAGGAGDGLVSVRGLSRSRVEALAEAERLEIAIVNPGDGYILGGPNAALERFRQAALDAGAQRSTLLAVSVASHTSRLASAVPALREAICAAAPGPCCAGLVLLDGLEGNALFTRDRAIEALSRQIAEPVRWDSCLDAACERGASRFLELGPGRALADMAAATYPAIPARGLEDFASLDGVAEWLRRVS